MKNPIRVHHVREEYEYVRKQKCECGGPLAVHTQNLEHMEPGLKVDRLTANCLDCGKQEEFLFSLDNPLEKKPSVWRGFFEVTAVGVGCLLAVVTGCIAVISLGIAIGQKAPIEQKMGLIGIGLVCAVISSVLLWWMRRPRQEDTQQFQTQPGLGTTSEIRFEPELDASDEIEELMHQQLYDQAVSLLSDEVSKAELMGDTKLQARLLARRGRVKRLRGEFETARDDLEHALELDANVSGARDDLDYL